jgi:cytochrome c553
MAAISSSDAVGGEAIEYGPVAALRPVLVATLAAFTVLAACRPAWRHEPFDIERVSPGLAVPEDGVESKKDPVTPAAPSPERQRLLAGMRDHYEIVAELEQAVIEGKLERVHERASSFAVDPLHETVQGAEHVLRMKAAARDAAAAENLEQAAAAVTTMAGACGGCHHALDVVPVLPPLPELDQGRTPKAAMHRHAWAADRMWEGLVVPSEERWIQGTSMFSFAPGCESGDERKPRDERETLCHRVRALGGRAHVTEAWPERLEIHARLLATCAACHQTSP